MTNIRPVSDLRNNFAEISRLVHEGNGPVFLTKNGYGDMVVMSIEAYNNFSFDADLYFKLKEAEYKEESGARWYSREEVDSRIQKIIGEAENDV